MVIAENNYSSVRKKDTNVRVSTQIQSMINNSIHRSIARHRHSHLGVGHHTTHHVDRRVTKQRHSHLGVFQECNALTFRGGVSRAYVDDRIAALLAMIVDLQAQIGGG